MHSKLCLIAFAIYFLLPIGQISAQNQVSDADLVFKIGANSVITNMQMLGQFGKLIKLDPANEAQGVQQGALQVQRTTQSCHDTLLAYAQERGIENELIIQKLLRGYSALHIQSTSMLAYLEQPNEENGKAYAESAEKAWQTIQADFFGPNPG